MGTTPKTRRTRKRALRARIARETKRMRKILADGKARLDSQILRAANDPKLAVSAARRNKLYRGIRDIYAAMSADGGEWARRMVTGTAKEAFRNAAKDTDLATSWDKFSQKHVADYMAAFDPRGVKDLAAINQLATSDVRWLRKQFVDVFREASITGASMREMSKELKSRIVGPRPDWKFVDKSGRRWKPDNYFTMVTRTTVATVNREAYLDAGTDAGVELYEVAGGPPTIAPPDPCWDWFGKILSVTGGQGYPTIGEAESDGLFHPNCIHYLAAVLPEEVEDAKRREQIVDDNRSDAKQAATDREEEQKARDKAELAAKKKAKKSAA